MAHDRDLDVPHEETLQAFDELVRAGKVGAVGASNYDADALAEALEISRLEGLVRFEWAQNSFSLLEQGDRQTVFALCHEHGIGYTPFGPLAGGWLTGKYRRDEAPPEGSRMTKRPEPYAGYATRPSVYDALDKLAARAAEHGVSMAALALAWLLHTPEITRSGRRPEHRRAARTGRRGADGRALDAPSTTNWQAGSHERGEGPDPVRGRCARGARHGLVHRGDGRGARGARTR